MTSQPRPAQPAPDSTASRLVSESLAYTAIDAAQNLLALIVVPASLFWLTPADMGVVTLALVASQIAMAVAVLGLDFGVLRFFLVWRDDERDARAAGALVVVFGAALALTAVTALLSRATMPSSAGLAVAAVAAGAGLAVRAVPLSVFRVTSALRPYAAIVIAGSALQAVLQIGALAAGLGILGFLAGASVASWVGALWASVTWLRSRPAAWRLRWPDGALIRLAGWNLSATIANRATASVDRLAVWIWSTVDSLGVYGTASRWSLPLRMVSGGAKLAIAPALSRAERAAVPASAAAPVGAFVTLLSLLAVVLLGLSSILLVTPWHPVIGEFQRLLSLLLTAQLIGCLTLIGQVLLYYRGKSSRSAALAMVSAVAAIACLWWLVPQHGARGAALAQCAASAITLGVFMGFSGRSEWAAMSAGAPLTVLLAVLAAPWFVGPGMTAAVSSAGALVLGRWAWSDWRGAIRRPVELHF